MVEVVKIWSDMLSFAEFEAKEAIVEVEEVVEDVVQEVETVFAPVEDIPAAADPASDPPDIDPA
jgi:hypothetical protein